APEGSSDLTITATGSEFTAQSTVLFNGQPLATTFVSTGRLQATIPSALLATERAANITVSDPQNGTSSALTFTVIENVPQISATVAHGRSLRDVTVSGQVIDQALEDHQIRIDFGDGIIQVVDLGVQRGGPFSISHHYKRGSQRARTISLTAHDDLGTA